MINAVPAVNANNLNTTNINQNSNTLSNMETTVQEIGDNSDILANVSNNYDFLAQVVSGQSPVMSVDDTLETQNALEEFSYETELVSKVVSVGVQGINTLIKMQ